jgi:uncharacterized OB-fold protein
MDLFGGLMKGLKPLMDATGVKADESMQLAMVKGEASELEKKLQEVFAEMGKMAYEMIRSNSLERERLAALCPRVDEITSQLKLKQQELEKAQKSADDKKKQEDEKMAACTCPNCGEVNPENTRFCQSCGSKLGIQKPQSDICRVCGAENSPGSRFCGECGAKMEAQAPAEIKCPSCGAINAPGTRFCGDCGAKL